MHHHYIQYLVVAALTLTGIAFAVFSGFKLVLNKQSDYEFWGSKK
jgi:hypothetical protein